MEMYNRLEAMRINCIDEVQSEVGIIVETNGDSFYSTVEYFNLQVEVDDVKQDIYFMSNYVKPCPIKSLNDVIFCGGCIIPLALVTIDTSEHHTLEFPIPTNEMLTFPDYKVICLDDSSEKMLSTFYISDILCLSEFIEHWCYLRSIGYKNPPLYYNLSNMMCRRSFTQECRKRKKEKQSVTNVEHEVLVRSEMKELILNNESVSRQHDKITGTKDISIPILCTLLMYMKNIICCCIFQLLILAWHVWLGMKTTLEESSVIPKCDPIDVDEGIYVKQLSAITQLSPIPNPEYLQVISDCSRNIINEDHFEDNFFEIEKTIFHHRNNYPSGCTRFYRMWLMYACLLTGIAMTAAQSASDSFVCDFASSTDLGNRTWLTGWRCVSGVPSTSVCDSPSWTGVTCSGSNIVGINLNYEGISGSIPSSIGTVTSLTSFIVQGNQLVGSIPSSIGNMISLQLLYFNNNKLTGSIPSDIGKLTSLRYFDVVFNCLVGSIPSSIGNMISLKELYFYYNKLTGDLILKLGL